VAENCLHTINRQYSTFNLYLICAVSGIQLMACHDVISNTAASYFALKYYSLQKIKRISLFVSQLSMVFLQSDIIYFP